MRQVVTRRTLAKYQLLFRHLFHCRHVERMLNATWKDHQATRPLLVPGGALARSYSLSQQMVHFMRNYIHYMTFEVSARFYWRRCWCRLASWTR